MGILSRWIKKKDDTSKAQFDFGRFSDAYKSDDQYEAWERSEALFAEGKHSQAILEFVKFLSNDSARNLEVDTQSEYLKFHFYQGSAKVNCWIQDGFFIAESGLVQSNEPENEVLNHMLQINYHLRYSRYSWDQFGTIKLRFDSSLEDLNNYKMYYALRELSLLADQKDDVILQKWRKFHAVDNDHLKKFSHSLKLSRVDLIQHQLERLFENVNKPQYQTPELANVITYFILDTIYKLDFLTQPQGRLMESIDEVHRVFYSKKSLDRSKQNHMAIQILDVVNQLERVDLERELYQTNQIFASTDAVGADTIIPFIENESGHLRWFSKKEYAEVAESIYGFIIGHILYCYAPPLPIRALLSSWYHINHPEYFKLHGYSQLQVKKGRMPFGIKEMYEEFEKECQLEYPNFRLEIDDNEFKDKLSIGKWILRQIKLVDLSNQKKDE